MAYKAALEGLEQTCRLQPLKSKELRCMTKLYWWLATFMRRESGSALRMREPSESMAFCC